MPIPTGDSSDTSNTGGKCNATISILITEAWKPKITTFKIENVAYADFASIVDANIYALTEVHANDSSVYIISAIIDIIQIKTQGMIIHLLADH